MSRQDKAVTERHARILRELVKQPENKVCADCKRSDPRWASWNLGVYLCIRCSGIHRSMGTHISRVKSIDLDVWTPEQMSSIQKWGNTRANLYWEARLKSGHIPPDHKVESFIRSKYESRRWALNGPPPDDPSVLQAKDNSFSQNEAEAESHLLLSQESASSSKIHDAPTPMNGSFDRNINSRTLLSRNVKSAESKAARTPEVHGQELFNLDFTPTQVPDQPKPSSQSQNTKQDILSLYTPQSTGNSSNSVINARYASQEAATTQPGFGTMAPQHNPTNPWVAGVMHDGWPSGGVQTPTSLGIVRSEGSTKPAAAPVKTEDAFGDLD